MNQPQEINIEENNPLKGWRECKLGDYARINMGQSPKSEFYNDNNHGMPFLQGNRTFGRRYPSFDTYCEKPIKIAKKGEVLFSVRAPVGDINFANRDFCIGRGLCSLDSDNNNFLYFLLYFIKLSLISLESGTVFGSVNKNDLNNFDILLPPLPEQEAIAEVLSSLDDKIDLLHRQNKTLESLAETLFRHHFIENANPNWEEKPLDEIADYLNGLACQKYAPKDNINKLPVLKIREIRTGFTDNTDWATTEVPEKYIVNSGDVIFSWSGSLEVVIWKYGKCVLNQHLFKVTSAEYPKWFYYFATLHHLKEFRSIASDKATTMGHIQRKHLSEAMINCPDEDGINEYNSTFEPLLEKIISNNEQIQTLEKLRDTLLPKLMSGEIRVRF